MRRKILRSVPQSAPIWHADHGFGDLCASCHAGEPAASAKEQAHRGLRDPLADPTISCAAGHANDASVRAERYRAVVVSTTTAPSAPPPSNPSPSVRGGSRADRVLATFAVLLTLALYFVLRREPATARRPLVAWLRDKTWSPYAAGVLLGLVVALPRRPLRTCPREPRSRWRASLVKSASSLNWRS